ncbi:hypothetical protein CWI38_2197p0010 [Hamiltosporidium tvaerminnensis]|uniref:Uncharacterized protein n=1 Tax=Hamiltosporidium tvaerminnensis TaxID=1176355 RepID=A0A4Q9LM63_9MICR|nr:hypothetical protein CWI38_2197p0010 [Hamiltosporidium tvaerminnensis]
MNKNSILFLFSKIITIFMILKNFMNLNEMEGMVDVKGVGVTDVKLAEVVAVDVLEAEVVNVTAAVVDAVAAKFFN